jgi:S1-C subfamily serine protease
VKQFFDKRGVKYTEHDVSVDKAAADEMVRKSGQMGVPVVIVGDQVIVGFDRKRLDKVFADADNGRKPRFGLQVADASKLASKFGLVPVFGAFVGRVAPSSLGEKAGLRKGDVITELNFRPIHNTDDLENALTGLTHGNRVMIVFLRGHDTLRSEIFI